MPGETDLEVMLATLAVDRRPGVFTYVTVATVLPDVLAEAHAIVREGSSTTVVLPVEAAERDGHMIELHLAWLTLRVQSSLEAVGLTAAVSQRLARENIPCNVLAGYLHDHVLVPVDRVDVAIAALTPERG